MVTYLSIIGRLVRVLGGLGVSALFGRVAGCHRGPLFLTAFSIGASLLSSKIHTGDDTPKDYWDWKKLHNE